MNQKVRQRNSYEDNQPSNMDNTINKKPQANFAFFKEIIFKMKTPD